MLFGRPAGKILIPSPKTALLFWHSALAEGARMCRLFPAEPRRPWLIKPHSCGVKCKHVGRVLANPVVGRGAHYSRELLLRASAATPRTCWALGEHDLLTVTSLSPRLWWMGGPSPVHVPRPDLPDDLFSPTDGARCDACALLCARPCPEPCSGNTRPTVPAKDPDPGAAICRVVQSPPSVLLLFGPSHLSCAVLFPLYGGGRSPLRLASRPRKTN